jgi:uncharacterized protein (DUF2235 family)
MAKNIIVCFDGTWNGVDVDNDKDDIPEETNILKLYRALAGEVTRATRDLPDEEEREARDADNANNPLTQIAKYLHGVGDVSNPIGKILGGAFGAGMVARIVRGYTYICRNYKAGDRIYLVGFSRGAYTARAVGGMIAKAGLMNYAALGNPDKETAYQLGLYVWCYYREQMGYRAPANEDISDAWGTMLSKSYVVGEEQMIADVPVEAVAVFDTVGALGIPIYNHDDARIDLFKFTDTSLSPKVKAGIHAVAIDEYRRDFSPTLWDARAGVEERWFIGAHADVGGGYEDTGLSNLSMAWMQSQLAACSVKFSAATMNGGGGDPLAEIHDPWNRLPYKLHPRKPRAVPVNATLHLSVKTRCDAPNAGGSPPGTPSPYAPEALSDWQGTYERA